jgi:cell division protein FtsB
MRWPAFVLVALLILLQYPLWFGKGGWLRVWDVDRKLAEQRELNQTLEQRNAGLDAEVRDLKTGTEAIEERARYELGLIKQDEVFVQVPQKRPLGTAPAPSAAAPATPRSGTQTPASPAGTVAPKLP